VATIQLKDAAEFIGNIGPELTAKAVLGVRKAGARALGTLVTVIIPSRDPQPVDRGIYRAGWKLRLIPNGVEIYNDTPAAAVIEYGARAKNIKIGRKLLNALAEWAVRKGMAKDLEEGISIAWAIAKKAKAGKGFHNRKPGGGQRIMEELVQKYLPGYVRDAVRLEISR